MIYTLLFAPLITALLCALLPNKRIMEIINAAGAGVAFIWIILVTRTVLMSGPIVEGFWYIDALSVYLLVVIGLISFLAALYSISYLDYEYQEKEIDIKKIRQYYPLYHIFFATMILACITDNLGMMWVAIEGTTLASAFLVGFYNKKSSIEAAWKYIIICSAGIALAFLGTILAYQASVVATGESENSMNWTVMIANAAALNPAVMKIAFIFIFIGFGTKVGLAPMHTWLPDAHSQSPTPISALLSGVLLNVAMYVILRYHAILLKVVGPGFSDKLFLVFGFLSLILATGFIIASKDYKRLLAYCSIEHMGIISIGIGIGGAIGLYGAIFHLFNHALVKSFLFFGAGNILLKYKTRDMEKVKGLAQVMPATATLFITGMFALTGNPPFSIFMSELTIVQSMIVVGSYALAFVFLGALVMIFGGFVSHAAGMVFGVPESGEKDKSHAHKVSKGEVSIIGVIVMVVLLIIITYIGIYIPPWFNKWITDIVALF